MLSSQVLVIGDEVPFNFSGNFPFKKAKTTLSAGKQMVKVLTEHSFSDRLSDGQIIDHESYVSMTTKLITPSA